MERTKFQYELYNYDEIISNDTLRKLATSVSEAEPTFFGLIALALKCVIFGTICTIIWRKMERAERAHKQDYEFSQINKNKDGINKDDLD